MDCDSQFVLSVRPNQNEPGVDFHEITTGIIEARNEWIDYLEYVAFMSKSTFLDILYTALIS